MTRDRQIRIDTVMTRGGDGGETSLGDGTRLRKDAPRVEAIGAVDEANAAIGLVALHAGDAAARMMLQRVQNDLFDLGADLCVPGTDGDRLRLSDAPAARLDAEIAAMNAGLPPLTSFVLPGGTAASTYAHLARTVVRRAERRVIALAGEATINPAVIRYLNRLSDHLFVLARQMNAGQDILWVPGGRR